VRLTDAGGGAGTWDVTLAPQSASAGTAVDLPGTVVVPPGGEGDLPVVARAAADSPAGEDYGFVVLRKGTVVRRIPYLFLVSRPRPADAPVTRPRRPQSGATRTGASRVDAYRYPIAPFGNDPGEPPMQEVGAEHVYATELDRPAVNIGVSVLSHTQGAR